MRNFLIITVLLFSSHAWAADRILIFAPSSLTEVIGKVVDEFSKSHDSRPNVSIAGTAQLARQLEAGAPADIFVSADKNWMEWLKSRDLIEPASVKPIAGNRLVVAVRREVENWADVKAMLTQDRFAMAEPETVPAGRYGKQALIASGLWQQAKGNAVFGENVRVTLRRVALGEVAAALVYASDVHAEPRTRIGLMFKADNHDAIVYRAALTKNARDNASEFLAFLSRPFARKVFAEAGFETLPTSGN